MPIIALSQLSRATELRGGSKRPQLSDLRESGAIEQDADIVVSIHRPEYYGINQDENGMPTAGMAEIIIAKHRNGAVTDVNLRFLKDQARFADVDETLMPEAGSRPCAGAVRGCIERFQSGLGGFGGVPEEFLTPGVSGGARESGTRRSRFSGAGSGFRASVCRIRGGGAAWKCGSGNSDRSWRKIA